jgi:hypothetical protein
LPMIRCHATRRPLICTFSCKPLTLRCIIMFASLTKVDSQFCK